MDKEKRKISLVILSALMALSFIFMGIMFKPKAYATTVPTPKATYTMTNKGDIVTVATGGLAILSETKAKMEIGDTYYMGYTVDSISATAFTGDARHSLLLSTLYDANPTRSNGDLTVNYGAKGLSPWGGYNESSRNLLEAGASYVISFTLVDNGSLENNRGLEYSITKTTATGSTTVSLGNWWGGASALKDTCGDSFSFGLWITKQAVTYTDLALSNVYFMDSEGNDLGVKPLLGEGGETINFNISKNTPKPKATYSMSNKGDLVTVSTGGLAILSGEKTKMKIGDTYYMGYTVDSISATAFTGDARHSLLLTTLYDANPTRSHGDLTVNYGAKGLSSWGGYNKATRNLLEAGASYVISFTLVDNGAETNNRSLQYSITKTIGKDSTTISLGNWWGGASALKDTCGDSFSFGIWITKQDITYSNLALSNVYFMDSEGNDLGVKPLLGESGETINFNIVKDAPQPKTTYSMINKGDVVTVSTGGLAILSKKETKMEIGETYYMGYTVDSISSTSLSDTRQSLLLTTYDANDPYTRSHNELTVKYGAFGLSPYGGYDKSTRNLLEEGASYVISFKLVNNGSLENNRSLEYSIAKFTDTGFSVITLGNWCGGASALKDTCEDSFCFGLWIAQSAVTYSDLALSNVYFMDSEGNDLGVKTLGGEGGETINFNISKNAPTPKATYSMTNNGDVVTVASGGLAILSETKAKMEIGDTYYMGYTVDSISATFPSETRHGLLLSTLYDANPTRSYHELTVKYGAKGLSPYGGYNEATRNLLEEGASYLISFTLVDNGAETNSRGLEYSITKTTATGSTTVSLGNWLGGASALKDECGDSFCFGLWITQKDVTYTDLVLSNVYFMDSEGNDLGVKPLLGESGETINFNISKNSACKATFNRANGTEINSLAKSVNPGTEITLPIGATSGFICWKDDNGNLYNAGSKVTVNSAITFTEIVSAVSSQSYMLVQNEEINIDGSGLNISSENAKTMAVGDTVYMGYTVVTESVNLNVEKTRVGLLFTKDADKRGVDSVCGAAKGLIPFVAYSEQNDLFESGSTYRIAIKLVDLDAQAGTRTIETQVLKIKGDVVSLINLSSFVYNANSLSAEAGNSFYFGLRLFNYDGTISYSNIGLTNVYFCDESGNDLGVFIRSYNSNFTKYNQQESITDSINVTYKDSSNQDITEYCGAKQFGIFEVQNGISEGFICWKGSDGKFYKAGETVLSSQDITLNEICVKLSVLGAQIRLTDPTGLRFETAMKKDLYDALLNAFGEENVATGTLILPTDYLSGGAQFTIEDLNAKSIKYKNIVNDGANRVVVIEGEEYCNYYAALVKILAQNQTRKFSARSYITINLGGDTMTIYSDYEESKHSRSVYQVACGVYEDTEKELQPILDGFINAVVNITGDSTSGYTVEKPACYDEAVFNVSNESDTITITAKAGYDLSGVKVISVNGGCYTNFQVEDNKIVITVS